MKSYLRFLSRNKLYTAIEVVGLSIALAFVIVLGSYILTDLRYNSHIYDADEIHVLRNKTIMNEFLVRHELVPDDLGHIPGIKDMCSCFKRPTNFGGQVYTAEYQEKEYILEPVLAADRNIFSFFDLPLLNAEHVNVLNNVNGAVISQSLAEKIFGDESPLGKEIFINFSFNHKCDFIIEGVFPEFPDCVIPEPEVIIRMDRYLSIEREIFRWSTDSEITKTQFIRIDHNTSLSDLTQAMDQAYDKVAPREEFYDIELVSLKDFHRKEGHISRDRGGYLNFRNADTFRIYIFICILLALLSILNYILLTIAYSHFRIKEIATRQLLGTERRDVIARCTFEALFLLLVSMAFAIAIVYTCKPVFCHLLGTELTPLSSFTEYVIMACVALVMAVPAGLASSFALSKYSPAEIIKGQKRKQEKMVLSKLFICIEGFMAITSTIILIAVTLQIRFMLNYPLGYETEDLIYVQFNNDIPRHIDQLRAIASVENVGHVDDIPMYQYRVTFPKEGGHIGLMYGHRAALEMLGLSIHDYGPPADSPYSENLYLSRETMDALTNSIEDGEWLLSEWGSKRQIYGTCSHFRTGDLKQYYTGLCGVVLIIPHPDEMSGQKHDLIVKSNGNEAETCRQIEEMYTGLGYDSRAISIKPLTQYLEDALAEEISLQNLLLVFTITCLLLTVMAIAAFSSYYAQLRVHDTAVRKAFGESRKEVFWKTVRGFVMPAIISAVIAIPVSYVAVSEWLKDFMLKIDNSWMIYAGGFLFILAVIFASIILQALRLMRTNPAEALKKE